MNKTITLDVKDANAMNAYVSVPVGEGPFPAVMVFQEAWGINGHMRKIADKMAEEGYIAVAPELFHRTAEAGFTAPYGDFGIVQPHFTAITTEALEADVQATYDWVISQNEVRKDKVGCIGYCLGGRVSFIANSLLPLQASVSYYGGSTHILVDRAENIAGPHLFFWGGKDTHILPEHVQAITDALKNAGKDYINVLISYAEHAFNNDERASYNAEASTEAWGIAQAFLKNKLT